MKKYLYDEMDVRKVERIPEGLSIAAQAVDEFKASTAVHGVIIRHNEARAKALLTKVLGVHSKYAWIKHDSLAHPVFSVESFELTFTQGATPDDDQFSVSYLGKKSPILVRSFASLGLALYHCFAQVEEYEFSDPEHDSAYPAREVREALLRVDKPMFAAYDEGLANRARK